MSYPPPTLYPHPHPGQPQHHGESLLAPAKRASNLMFGAVALGLVFGGCVAFAAIAMRTPSFANQPGVREQLDAMKGPDGKPLDPAMMTLGMALVAAMMIVYCLALGINAIFVRRGRLPSLIFAIILVVIGVLSCAVNLIGGLLTGQAGSVLSLLPLALLVVTAVSLVQAMARASQVTAAQGFPVQMAAPMYYNPYAYPPPPGYPGYPPATPAPQAPVPPPGQQPPPPQS